MAVLADITKGARKAEAHRPWPRFTVGSEAWRGAVNALVEARATLLSLWGDKEQVHLALLEEPSADIVVVTLNCPDGKFPSVGVAYPPAIRLERAIRDLYGLKPVGAADTRVWFDLGFWGVSQPLGANKKSRKAQQAYAFLPVEGEDLHQIPVGPVHAGIIEPGHFRFTANGEAVVRLEERLGYVHKGIDGLMIGADLDKGAKLAGRVSGDSTIAYALGFAQAVEAAYQLKVPERAVWLRALMAELERIANHCGDIGAICNDASFSILQADFAILRERVLRASDACFGHRLMRDRIVPGGVTQDVAPGLLDGIATLIETIRGKFPELVEVYDNTASLQDRTVTTGYLSPTLARAFGAGGYVGRASGRAFDARKAVAYAPYDQLDFEVPVRDDGDVNARVWIRIREVEQSLRLLEQIMKRMPNGPIRAELGKANAAGEGLALVEAFRGDLLVSVRLGADGRIERCHLRDASWFQWPLLEACVEGNIVADFPLCNKSFNCSYSGHDL